MIKSRSCYLLYGDEWGLFECLANVDSKVDNLKKNLRELHSDDYESISSCTAVVRPPQLRGNCSSTKTVTHHHLSLYNSCTLFYL